MKYIRCHYGVYFIFFNDKYYFGLYKDQIENGWKSNNFIVNHDFYLNYDPELKNKYPKKKISNKEINKQIQIIREKFPELML